jgi:hypothetical protein
VAVTKQFDGLPLQVVATAEMKERVIAIADAEEISQAQVIREILDEGLPRREKKAGIKHG